MISESLRLGHGPMWMHSLPTEDVVMILAANKAPKELERRKREDLMMRQYGESS